MKVLLISIVIALSLRGFASTVVQTPRDVEKFSVILGLPILLSYISVVASVIYCIIIYI